MHAKITAKAIRAILLAVFIIRIGEAQNPGPADEHPGLTIGAINPTGLLRKSSCFSQLPSEPNVIWGICETHLTTLGIRKFKQELHCNQKNLSFYAGAPAPYRSSAITAVAGTHVGTGFVTSLPCRNLQKQCTDIEWNSARISLNTFLVNETWVHGAVIYGHAHRADTFDVRQATDNLLEIATHAILQNLKGPRFIMGDFNQLHGTMSQPELWERMRWKEAQILHAERTGEPIQATCKQTSTKDFLYMSPELAQFFRGVQVVNHVFSDHAALCAHFQMSGTPQSMFHWRIPKPLPWKDLNGSLPPQPEPVHTELNSDEACKSIALQMEQRLHDALVEQGKIGLLPCQRGRCQTFETKKLKAHSKPLKPSRQGDVQPVFQGQTLQHQRQFTQLRRLESLRRLYNKVTWTTSQATHASREWRAILKAPGFGHFPTWWSKVPEKFADAPASLTAELPTAVELSGLCLVVDREVRRMEKVLQAELVAKAKHNRVVNPHKIFQDFAKPKAAPVSVLQDSTTATVTEVDHEQVALILDKPNSFASGEILSPHGPFTPIAMCEDVIWPESVANFVPGQVLRQEHFVGQLEELFQRFAEEWKARWDKHKDVPTGLWSPLKEFYELAQPPGPSQTYQPITIQQWKKAVARKKLKAASGPDGWSRQDLLQLPDDLTQAILNLLTRVEKGQACWPIQWLTGIVHSLEKQEGAATVSNYRPITVFSLIYRTWASIRAKEILQHLLPQMPCECFGNLPSRCTTNLWVALQSTLEHDHANGQHSCGAVLDIVKCFNFLPREPLLYVLQHMGVAPQILHAWKGALSQMERRFAIRGSVSHAVLSTTGFAEGCSLSVIAMLSANQLMEVWMKHKVPTVRLLSYVDNLELLAQDPSQLMSGTNQRKRILRLMDLSVDESKTYLWSPNGQFRKLFIQNGYNVRKAARDVGAHLQYTRQATNFTITSKIEGFKDRWKNPCSFTGTLPAETAGHQSCRLAKYPAWYSIRPYR